MVKHTQTTLRQFAVEFGHFVKLALKGLRYFASKVWTMLPAEIKNSSNIEMFKNKLSKRAPSNCNCNFAKIICIELDMLTLLMTNPFFASV